MVNVLIIDDNKEIASLIADIFNTSSISAEYVVNGDMALEYVKNQPMQEFPSMYILDVILPGLSGPELMKSIQNVVSNARFMLMTAYINIPEIVAMNKENVVEVFYKPFKIEEMVAKVKFVLSNTQRIAVQ